MQKIIFFNRKHNFAETKLFIFKKPKLWTQVIQFLKAVLTFCWILPHLEVNHIKSNNNNHY